MAACATPRAPFTADELSLAHPVGFPPTVLVDAAAVGFAPGFQPQMEGLRDGGLDILALSGGGAQGAYGAGVLVGWTASGERPEFQIVSGVSTGALQAPFAFLGPTFDDRLRRAFSEDQTAAHLLRWRGPAMLWRPGVFSGAPLRTLVDRYVDDRLVEAVAAADAGGRRLLIATTALDSQRTTVWNMGAIARRGGPEATHLFRQVCLASASIPGALPPVQIEVEAGGRRFTEMHVDGSVTSPFFTVPENLLLWTGPTGQQSKGGLYVVLNAQVRPEFRVTPDRPVAVGKDSLIALNNAFARTALAATEAFCKRNGMRFQVATLPPSAVTGGILDFRLATMRKLYAEGEADGRSGKAWTDGLEESWLEKRGLSLGLPGPSPSAATPPGTTPRAK